MRYLYSVVRFVPDPARGEFVNVAAIVGNEETGEWDVRQVENLRRARALDDRDALPAVAAFLESAGRTIDEWIVADDTAATNPELVEPSREWLTYLASHQRNVVQLTQPTPVVAQNLEEAVGIVFDELIIDPAAEAL